MRQCSGKTATSIHEWRLHSRILARLRPALATGFEEKAPTPNWGGDQPGDVQCCRGRLVFRSGCDVGGGRFHPCPEIGGEAAIDVDAQAILMAINDGADT